jgi:hypothetical protein
MFTWKFLWFHRWGGSDWVSFCLNIWSSWILYLSRHEACNFDSFWKNYMANV